jgi:hypothetical protein
MYRPQFSFPEPQQGTYDEDFVYSFDPYNTPALDVRLGPNGMLLRIPLQMQSDAAFVHRGLKLNPSLTSFLGVQLFFPDDTPLTDDLVPLSAFAANTGNPAPILEPDMLVPAGASYQLNVVNRSLTQSALPISANINPVLVDPINFGHGAVLGADIPSAGGFGPFAYDGALYMFLNTDSSVPFVLEAMQSLDGGATWQALDFGNSPNGNAMPIFDGDHTVIVAVSTAAVDSDGDVNLINFDLSTGTWGALYATASAPTTQQIYMPLLRPDGSIVVLHNPRASGSPASGSGLFAAVYASGAWATNFDLGAGIASLPGYNVTDDFVYWTNAVVDPNTGVTHVFFQTVGDTGPPNWIGRTFYQMLNADNSLGTFYDFPGNDTQPTLINNILNANPIIVGDQLLLAFTRQDTPLVYVTLIVGTNLAAPTFQYVGPPGIDPIAFQVISPGNDGQNAPYLLYDGQTIFALYPAGVQNGSLRLCYTNTPSTPGTGWTSVEIFNIFDVGPPFNFSFQLLERQSLNLIGDTIFVTTDANAPVGIDGTNARYVIGSFTVEPIRIQLRGVKRYVRTKRKQVCAK